MKNVIVVSIKFTLLKYEISCNGNVSDLVNIKNLKEKIKKMVEKLKKIKNNENLN